MGPFSEGREFIYPSCNTASAPGTVGQAVRIPLLLNENPASRTILIFIAFPNPVFSSKIHAYMLIAVKANKCKT